MLYIAFTDKFEHNNIFENLSASRFAQDNNHVIILTSDMQSVLLDGIAYQSLDIDIAEVSLVVVNDIDINEKLWIKNLFKNLLNYHKEICVVYHNNGAWADQEELLESLINDHVYADYFESRVIDSVYFEELGEVALAFAKKDVVRYGKALHAFKMPFLKKERKQIIEQLYDTDVLKTIDNFECSSFAHKHLISEEDCQMLISKIKKVDQARGKICMTQLSEVINEYLKMN